MSVMSVMHLYNKIQQKIAGNARKYTCMYAVCAPNLEDPCVHSKTEEVSG